MTEPTLHHVVCPGLSGRPAGTEAGTQAAVGHRMAYWQWGNPANPHVIVCVHGLSRQGRDFDVLAASLAPYARVVCPDVVGRGRSDWLDDARGYQIPVYAADMLALVAQLQTVAPIQSLDWVGTSMGGLIGILLAGQPALPLPSPLRKLVVNDVGPVIQWQALQRIGTYLGRTGRFDSVQLAADAMWAMSSSFGPHTPAQWLALSRYMVRPLTAQEPGAALTAPLTLHYDPDLAVPFADVTSEMALQGETALWQLYDQITARTLLLRGADSDLLSRATAEAMTKRGPCARLVELQGVGHAPTLVADDQVQVVKAFLLDD